MTLIIHHLLLPTQASLARSKPIGRTRSELRSTTLSFVFSGRAGIDMPAGVAFSNRPF